MTGTPCAREKSVDRSSDDRKRKRSGDTMAAPKKGKIGKLKYGARLRVVPLLGKMGTIFQQVYVFWRAAGCLERDFISVQRAGAPAESDLTSD